MSGVSRSLAILGCGYLGEEIARRALARNWRVSALTRNPAAAARVRAIGANPVVEADVTGNSWHQAMNEPVDAAVLCVGSGGRGLEGYRRSYVGGARSTVQWASRMKPGMVIFTGSTSVYPESGGVGVDEDSDTAECGPGGRLLLEAEDTLRRGLEPSVRLYLLRLGGIYGPGRHLFLDRLREGARSFPGSGTHRLNLIHRDDAAEAVCRIADHPEIQAGIYNLADGNPHSKVEIIHWLASRLGMERPGFEGGPDISRRRGGPIPDRRVVSDKIRRALEWEPEFPDFKAGYANILEGEGE